ncbi:MAG: hypothetical protein JXB47_02745, partial [Anaerolineae bacterium]|nr:hypothetical protein [Anaerolineae bacterium]
MAEQGPKDADQESIETGELPPLRPSLKGRGRQILAGVPAHEADDEQPAAPYPSASALRRKAAQPPGSPEAGEPRPSLQGRGRAILTGAARSTAAPEQVYIVTGGEVYKIIPEPEEADVDIEMPAGDFELDAAALLAAESGEAGATEDAAWFTEEEFEAPPAVSELIDDAWAPDEDVIDALPETGPLDPGVVAALEAGAPPGEATPPAEAAQVEASMPLPPAFTEPEAAPREAARVERVYILASQVAVLTPATPERFTHPEAIPPAEATPGEA